MKGERILYANDADIAREGIAGIMEKYISKDGHIYFGSVSSVEDLKIVLAQGYKPTVFLIDPKFPHMEGGIEAIGYLKVVCPDAKVATLPSYEGLQNVDKEFIPYIDVKELRNFLNNLQH